VEPGLLNVVLQAGAMGLLALIVVLIFKHAPLLLSAHKEGMTALALSHAEMAREAREQLDRVVETIRQDRHSDRNLASQQLMEFRLETKELRDVYTKDAALQRQHDDAKTEKLMAVINEQKSAMVDALHKIDESHRLLAEAIREGRSHS
jgi:hydroxylamine reductase (hybrid-cluster protein)